MLEIFLPIYSKQGLTVGAMNRRKLANGDIDRNSNILYVTLPFSYNESSNEVAKHFSTYFMKRDNSDKEVWMLGVDVLFEETFQQDM